MGIQQSALMGYFRQPKELKGFSGVSSGLATLRIPGGKLIHEITLVTNASAAQLLYAKLSRNGSQVLKLTGTQLTFLEQYKKLWTESGRFTITLSDIWMASMEGEVLSGLNTYADDDIELEVSFDTAAMSPTVPTLTGEVIESDFDSTQKLSFWEPRVRVVNLEGGPAGDDNIINNVHETKDGTEVIRRLHLYGGASDYITKLEIKRDDLQLHKQSTASMRYHAKRRGLAPQANWYHFDPVSMGFAVEAFNTAHARKLEFIPTLSTALTDVTAIIETLRLVRTG